MTTKGWMIFIAIIALALGGAIYLSRQGEVALENVDVNKIQAASPDNGQIADHVIGKADSKVMLIEYADFQCPGCASAAPTLKALSEKYKDKMSFVFRNRMMSYHPNARAAASFAEAAGLQGKYYEMHDKLFETQQAWEGLSGQQRTDFFSNLITQVGGNAELALSQIESEDIAKKLSYDSALSDKHGVTGTPSIFLNGKLVSDVYVKDGAIVQKGTEGAQLVWTDQEAFETLLIQPALKEAGIE